MPCDVWNFYGIDQQEANRAICHRETVSATKRGSVKLGNLMSSFSEVLARAGIIRGA
ncbi:hypothetical protein PT974_07384 [Cladobotryum mycophilum]|uniref:Uncharacterized protein n=1 Tax=Cladobotryum mycophilum TaxID=491253 RepID=A0ABR0SQ97_9HYPO